MVLTIQHHPNIWLEKKNLNVCFFFQKDKYFISRFFFICLIQCAVQLLKSPLWLIIIMLSLNPMIICVHGLIKVLLRQAHFLIPDLRLPFSKSQSLTAPVPRLVILNLVRSTFLLLMTSKQLPSVVPPSLKATVVCLFLSLSWPGEEEANSTWLLQTLHPAF